MSNDPTYVRQVAQSAYLTNPQTPKASEQSIPDYQTRATYNAEIECQRKQGS